MTGKVDQENGSQLFVFKGRSSGVEDLPATKALISRERRGLRVASYTRLSKYCDTSLSLHSQYRVQQDYVLREGFIWTPTTVFDKDQNPLTGGDHYVDNDISGSKRLRRPALEELLKKALAGEYDAIVVYRYDRWTRNMAEFQEVWAKLKAAGVILISATENCDSTTPVGEGTINILVSVAEMESANTKTRINDGVKTRLLQGSWLGADPAYGFKKERVTAKSLKLVPEPEQAEVVRRIVRMVLDRKPYPEIAELLNAEDAEAVAKWESAVAAAESKGMTSEEAYALHPRPKRLRPMGGKWNSSAIGSLVTSPLLAGYQMYQGVPFRHPDTNLPFKAYAALITDEEFSELQVETERRSRPDIRTRRDGMLLQGVAKCGECFGPLSANGGLVRRAYACRGTAKTAAGDPIPCVRPSASAKYVDQAAVLFAIEYVKRHRAKHERATNEHRDAVRSRSLSSSEGVAGAILQVKAEIQAHKLHKKEKGDKFTAARLEDWEDTLTEMFLELERLEKEQERVERVGEVRGPDLSVLAGEPLTLESFNALPLDVQKILMQGIFEEVIVDRCVTRGGTSTFDFGRIRFLPRVSETGKPLTLDDLDLDMSAVLRAA